ncbi:MAG: CBS domain-containing protein, partial [Candidatus Omnitrophica bacterium]|nr:CBS domain-containing protein [Candidatus Omnitrophota bacterium]
QLFAESNPVLSKMIFIVVMTETFIMELLGPVMVKIGVKKAGEIGLNVTEEDLIKTHLVGDVMDDEPSVIPTGMTFGEIIEFVSTTDSFYYPVLDRNGKLTGCLTLDSLRSVLQSQEMSEWLIALDVAEPVIATITPDIPLKQAFEHAIKMDIEHLPVVSSDRENKLLGLLDIKAVHRFLSAEVLTRHQKAAWPSPQKMINA